MSNSLCLLNTMTSLLDTIQALTERCSEGQGPMTDFIQSLLLSDPVIFVLIAFGVIAITLWAFSRREIAGYTLGWLFGLFLVLLFSTLFTRAEPNPDARGLTFLEVFFPGLIGISLGIGSRFLYTAFTPSMGKRSRSIAIAISMSSLLSVGYLILLSAEVMRSAIAIFAMGIVIGILSHRVFTRNRPPGATMRFQAQTAPEYENPDFNGNGYLDTENEVIEDLVGNNAKRYDVVPNVNSGHSPGLKRRGRQGRPPRI